MKIVRAPNTKRFIDAKPGERCIFHGQILLRVHYPDLRDPLGSGRIPFADERGTIGWYEHDIPLVLLIEERLLDSIAQGETFFFNEQFYIRGTKVVELSGGARIPSNVVARPNEESRYECMSLRSGQSTTLSGKERVLPAEILGVCENMPETS